MRRGMATGTGKGYKNIVGRDPHIHSQSAKGIKQPQRVNIISSYNPISNSKLLISESESKELKNDIKEKANKLNPKTTSQIYQDDFEKKKDGEYLKNKKGNISGYFWGYETPKGNNLSMNLTVVNGFEDNLFNDEGQTRIYYEIFPSASSNQANPEIFETFEKIQNTKKVNNYKEAKETINKIFKELEHKVKTN